MAGVQKISVALEPELSDAIRQAVESGDYASADEAINEALQQWARRRTRPASALPREPISVDQWKEFRDEGRP